MQVLWENKNNIYVFIRWKYISNLINIQTKSINALLVLFEARQVGLTATYFKMYFYMFHIWHQIYQIETSAQWGYLLLHNRNNKNTTLSHLLHTEKWIIVGEAGITVRAVASCFWSLSMNDWRRWGKSFPAGLCTLLQYFTPQWRPKYCKTLKSALNVPECNWNQTYKYDWVCSYVYISLWDPLHSKILFKAFKQYPFFNNSGLKTTHNSSSDSEMYHSRVIRTFIRGRAFIEVWCCVVNVHFHIL